MEKARAMRISMNLSHDMWKEIINAVIYLYNRISRKAQDWKFLYKVFFSVIEGFKKRLMLAYFKAYDYKIYAMIEKVQDKMKQKWKLNPRAYIGYLIEYDFINIFRIWIPFKDQIISMRDVLFDEYKFFDGKLENMTA